MPYLRGIGISGSVGLEEAHRPTASGISPDPKPKASNLQITHSRYVGGVSVDVHVINSVPYFFDAASEPDYQYFFPIEDAKWAVACLPKS